MPAPLVEAGVLGPARCLAEIDAADALSYDASDAVAALVLDGV